MNEQIDMVLADGEHVIWCAPTQPHYIDHSKRKLESRINLAWGVGIAWLLLVLGSAGLFDVQSSGGALLWILFSSVSFGIFAIGFPVYVVYKRLYIRKLRDVVNVVSNRRILLYDMTKRRVMLGYRHEDVGRCVAQVYGDNIGNIVVHKRRDTNQQNTVNGPRQFTLGGLDDLSKIVQILQSQVGIEIDTTQNKSKAKS